MPIRSLGLISLMILMCSCRQQASQPAPEVRVQARAAAVTDSRTVIVCFGDSLTAGFGVDPGMSYPDILQSELDRQAYRYRVVNLGVSGDTSQDGLDRLSLVIDEHPAIVVLEFGANDGLRGQPIANTEKNLAQIMEQLQNAHSQVVLAGITLPPNYGPEYIHRFEAVYTGLAQRYKTPLIPFLLSGVAGNPNLMQRDGLHPNAAGTRLVAATVMRSLEPLLRRN